MAYRFLLVAEPTQLAFMRSVSRLYVEVNRQPISADCMNLFLMK